MENNIDLDQGQNLMKMAKRRCEQSIKCGPHEQKEVRLGFPSGDPDLEGLRSVTREWLVPRLVEKFLRTHGVELRASGTSMQTLQAGKFKEKPTTAHFSEGDAE